MVKTVIIKATMVVCVGTLIVIGGYDTEQVRACLALIT